MSKLCFFKKGLKNRIKRIMFLLKECTHRSTQNISDAEKTDFQLLAASLSPATTVSLTSAWVAGDYTSHPPAGSLVWWWHECCSPKGSRNDLCGCLAGRGFHPPGAHFGFRILLPEAGTARLPESWSICKNVSKAGCAGTCL